MIRGGVRHGQRVTRSGAGGLLAAGGAETSQERTVRPGLLSPPRPETRGRRPQELVFCDSDNGGNTAGVLFSPMATCPRHQVDPFAYLHDVLTGVAATPVNQLGLSLLDRWNVNRGAATQQPEPAAQRPRRTPTCTSPNGYGEPLAVKCRAQPGYEAVEFAEERPSAFPVQRRLARRPAEVTDS